MTWLEWKTEAEALGGTAWIEEQFTRGQPGGGVKGGHVVFGREVGGVASYSPPQPLSVDLEDKEFQDVLAALNAAAIESVAEMTALSIQVESLTTERDGLAAAIAGRDEAILQLTTERDALGTTEEAQAIVKQQRKAHLEKQIDDAQKELDELNEPAEITVTK
jgi:hypothetical protein